jgi:hypothetical protein
MAHVITLTVQVNAAGTRQQERAMLEHIRGLLEDPRKPLSGAIIDHVFDGMDPRTRPQVGCAVIITETEQQGVSWQ